MQISKQDNEACILKPFQFFKIYTANPNLVLNIV